MTNEGAAAVAAYWIMKAAGGGTQAEHRDLSKAVLILFRQMPTVDAADERDLPPFTGPTIVRVRRQQLRTAAGRRAA